MQRGLLGGIYGGAEFTRVTGWGKVEARFALTKYLCQVGCWNQPGVVRTGTLGVDLRLQNQLESL